MQLSAGEIFAGYRIVRMLGSGGMGAVYLVQHPRLPRQDALKVLPADISNDDEFRWRFNREADAASKLFHPNIVGVHDRGGFNGHLWISMDFVDGLDAAHLLAKSYPSGMPVDHVVRIITAVASALDYAHKHDLVHRDVKPANIMLTHADEDGARRALLTDFGIVRSTDDISGLTATNMTIGTVAYSAPEQLMGNAIDGRADQYALAATAYHLLTGSRLFPQTNPAVVISHHIAQPPPSLADTMPGLARLDPVLTVALAKDPDDRFGTCSDFARALTGQQLAENAASAVAVTRPATKQRNSTPRASPSPTSVKSPKKPAGNRSQPRIGVIFLASITLIVAVLAIGGVAARFHFSRNNRPVISVPTTRMPAPELAPQVTTTVAAPPPVTVTLAPPPPPTAATSLPPLATPEGRIAEPIICSLHYQYPQMQPVDLALSLVDRGIYRNFEEASLVVSLVLADGCHGI